MNATIGFWVLLGALGLVVAPACTSARAPVASEWPPADFLVQVEELHEGDSGSVPVRRFRVTADGTCIYGSAPTAVVDPETRTALPVFRTLCAYRLHRECTRRLARRLHERDVLGLDPSQGDRRETKGQLLRFTYRAFGQDRMVSASGQIHGSFVRVLHLVNAYAPGPPFTLPGMVGDPEPANLTGVPMPVDDLAGALAFHERLIDEHPKDVEWTLDAFALACASGDRAKSQALLRRWQALADIGASAEAPFTDPPRLLPTMLERMLPP